MFPVLLDGGEHGHFVGDGRDVGQRRPLSDDRRKDLQRGLRPERALTHVQLRHVQLLRRVRFQGENIRSRKINVDSAHSG
jgi:hypothetical protein